MTGHAGEPLVEIAAIAKSYGAAVPLRVRQLDIRAGDRLALSGLDAAAAETLIHLITGASVPDEGSVRVGGRDTRHIATDTEWLSSLDQFGIVTARAVLIGSLPIGANMAVPLTLSIDPMSDDTRSAVEELADLVGIPGRRLADAASTLTPEELVRIHMARALAPRPRLLLLEHPTSSVTDAGARRSLGQVLRRAADARGAGWLALSEDADFARSSGSTRLRLRTGTGQVVAEGLMSQLFRRA